MAVFGALFVLCGCRSGGQLAELKPQAAATPMDPVVIDASYGTLTFHGTVERADNGSEFEYHTHIDVTFHPNEKVNQTPVAELREWRFVASVPGIDNGPWKV